MSFLPSLFSGQAQEQDPESTPAANTRSRAQNLQVPGTGYIARGARPPPRTPSPQPRQEGSFFPEDMAAPTPEIEELRRIAATALQALTAATNISSKPKKPDLPAFDTQNIEIWLKRVEAAYTRAGVTTPKDKFAFLEAKIAVDTNPRINDFLFGDATEARWNEFVEFLKEEYGRSTQQKVASVLDGVHRDGRRPSHHLSVIEDKTSSISLDDIRKEMMLRGLPLEIRRNMADKVKLLSARDAAKLADEYFDKDGKMLHPSTSQPISSIQEVAQEEEEDDEAQINAVGPRPASRQHSRSYKAGWKTAGTPQATPNNASTSRPRFPAKSNLKKICHYHNKFGDEARLCEEGCVRYADWKKTSNGQAGRRT